MIKSFIHDDDSSRASGRVVFFDTQRVMEKINCH